MFISVEIIMNYTVWFRKEMHMSSLSSAHPNHPKEINRFLGAY